MSHDGFKCIKCGWSTPEYGVVVCEKGYIKENVWVISYKANRMKSNATLEEFEKIYINWSKKQGGEE